ncbi:MAG TPA: GlsB/YeaQ/YmgE family stress response membrane protein [Stellaceae bacterium]|nr:GlsB/YeaQ/YmgE family stress response membrane protein [Stellaceae bacterium]
MSILAWIALGLIAGFIASKIVNRRGEGIVSDIVIGIVGVIVGGWITTAVVGAEVNGFTSGSSSSPALGPSCCC